MKNYVNHKFCLVEDDEIVSTCNNKTDIFCVILSIIGILTIIAGIAFAASVAKSEAKEYRADMETQLCHLMEFNGSTYHCGE